MKRAKLHELKRNAAVMLGNPTRYRGSLPFLAGCRSDCDAEQRRAAS